MDILGMMKKAREMQARMQDVQDELERTIVEGQAGGGVVTVQMTAKGDLLNVEISQDLLAPGEKDILQDLIVTAHKEARSKATEVSAGLMQDVTAGLPLPPGLKLPF